MSSFLASLIRRKAFISYHHDDERAVQLFIAAFDHGADCFIARGINAGMAGDIINSTSPDYVMERIRAEYLRDSSVTIVMIGHCAWSRRYVDWELQASLRHGETITPNGVIGIRLWGCSGARYPDRLNRNLPPWNGATDGYARVYDMPTTAAQLSGYLEEAYRARTQRAHLIDNPRERVERNKDCGHWWH